MYHCAYQFNVELRAAEVAEKEKEKDEDGEWGI
jgi:hypothetical protein